MTIKKEQVYSICYGLIVGVYTTLFHEFWRDETQAFQMARHAKGIAQLLVLGRYEGHPPLLYFIFFITSRIFPIPFALSVVGALGSMVLCYGTFRFLRLYFDEKRALLFTVLMSFSFLYCYELGVVVRGYGLGVGLVLWAIAIADNKKFGGALALFCFASLLSMHAALFAATAFLVFVMPHVRRKPWLSAIFFSCFCFSVLYCVYPNPDRPYLQIGQIVQNVPPKSEFWNRADALYQELIFPRSWWFLFFEPNWVYPARFFLAFSIVAAIFFLLREKPSLTKEQKSLFLWAFFNAVLFIGALWILHFGGYRHRLHVYLPIWLAIGVFSFQTARGRFKNYQLVGQVFLIVWLGLQYMANVVSLTKDVRLQFSPTYQLTKLIPKDAKVLVETDWEVTSLPFWRDDIEIRPLNAAGRRFKFAKWDYARSRWIDWYTLFTTVCLESPHQSLVTLTHSIHPTLQFWCTNPPFTPVPDGSYAEGIRESQFVQTCTCDGFFDYMRNPVKFHREYNQKQLREAVSKREKQP